LVRAFNIVKNKYPDLPLKLLLVGRGSQTEYIKSLLKEFNLESDSVITGFVPYNEISKHHNMLDIYVSVSTEDSESFGVAILEASACEKPVIVSNVGGLPEVVENEKTGFIIEKENPSVLAEVLSILVNDNKMRSEIGRNGRKKVLREYDWENSLNKMITVYDSIIS
jgi:glycosyltransferase involved in cell wall biosynthesis